MVTCPNQDGICAPRLIETGWTGLETSREVRIARFEESGMPHAWGRIHLICPSPSFLLKSFAAGRQPFPVSPRPCWTFGYGLHVIAKELRRSLARELRIGGLLTWRKITVAVCFWIGGTTMYCSAGDAISRYSLVIGAVCLQSEDHENERKTHTQTTVC